jgi:hypothetical protein
MATLIRLSDSEPVRLPSSALAGRSAACWLRLDHRLASSEHAKIAFLGHGWMLKDIGSKNGTYVDGRRIDSGGAVMLSSGMRIGFGDLAPSHVVADVDPPQAVAQDLESGEIVFGMQDLLALPDDEHPEAVVYPGRSGWVFEPNFDETREVDDLDVVRVGARLFRLFLPLPSSATPMVRMAFTLRNTQFRFIVDGRGRCAGIDLLFRGVAVARLQSIESGPLLLALARARIADQSRPNEERGWRSVEELCDEIDVDPAALNVAIHRARKRVGASKIGGASELIEVRRGERRLGTDAVEVVLLEELGGARLECR